LEKQAKAQMKIFKNLFSCLLKFRFLGQVVAVTLGLGGMTIAVADDLGIHGAGSTAAALIYQGWGREYQNHAHVALTYESIGSGAGIKKIGAREVDFGATDVAPSDAELERAGLILIPVAITGIAPVFNIPRLNDQTLRLTGEVLAMIFMGQITRWDATEIADLNEGLKLPDMAIKVVVRSDGSGTSYNFGDYLGKVNKNWQGRMGAKTTYSWPENVIAVKGSDAVVKAVSDNSGSIGYVDFGYAREARLSVAQIKNSGGVYVKASAAAFRAALMGSSWVAKGVFKSSLTDMPGKDAWPLTMGTFVLIPKVFDSAEQATLTLNYFTWALLKGDKVVEENNFVRLPNLVQASAFRAMVAVKDKKGSFIPVNLQ
jgi:phosphate transport system substrate-binding protein